MALERVDAFKSRRQKYIFIRGRRSAKMDRAHFVIPLCYPVIVVSTLSFITIQPFPTDRIVQTAIKPLRNRYKINY